MAEELDLDLKLKTGVLKRQIDAVKKEVEKALGPSIIKSIKIGVTKGGKVGVKDIRMAPSEKEGVTEKTLKLYKIDLFWKWIKGSWQTLTKYVPLLRGIADAIAAAISLALTALVLPFLPELIGIMKFLLERSVEFFRWTKQNTGTIRDVASDMFNVLRDIALISPSGFLKTLSLIGTKIYQALVPEFLRSSITWLSEKLGSKGLGAVVTKLIAWLGEQGLVKVLGKVLTALAGFANPLLWSNIIFELLSGALKLLIGTGNPLTRFVDFLAQATDIVGMFIDAIKDVVGLFGGGQVGALAERFDKMGEALYGGVFGLKRGFLTGMANGGIVNSPTPALIGEAGPEAVIPLDRMGGMGNVSVNVQGIVDENKFRSIIRDEFNKMQGRLNKNRGAVAI